MVTIFVLFVFYDGIREKRNWTDSSDSAYDLDQMTEV